MDQFYPSRRASVNSTTEESNILGPVSAGKILYADRSFFGSYRATLHADVNRHVLFQGTTVHGAQSADAQMRLQPLTYFHRTGPAGQVLSLFEKLRGESHVAIVGLGAGALACHGSADQRFTFYEIDPLVEKIARDENLFTYLRDCPPKITVVIGDARLSLSKAADNYHDLLVLDAFSSDVIPTHLLTREALQLYLKKTAADGILLAHISNRYMDLAPVLGGLAQSLNLVAYIQNDFDITPKGERRGKVRFPLGDVGASRKGRRALSGKSGLAAFAGAKHRGIMDR